MHLVERRREYLGSGSDQSTPIHSWQNVVYQFGVWLDGVGDELAVFGVEGERCGGRFAGLDCAGQEVEGEDLHFGWEFVCASLQRDCVWMLGRLGIWRGRGCGEIFPAMQVNFLLFGRFVFGQSVGRGAWQLYETINSSLHFFLLSLQFIIDSGCILRSDCKELSLIIIEVDPHNVHTVKL